MIKAERESRIVTILNEAGVASIRTLSQRLGGVPEVTVRRDVARLASRGVLERSHGGASRLRRSEEAVASPERPAEFDPPIEDTDAIVLPPLEGRGAETLRLMARRRHTPFLAESAPQAGGIYLGADNFAAGHELGEIAARSVVGRMQTAKILLVSQDRLPKTPVRSPA